jgi:hypothetical protein
VRKAVWELSHDSAGMLVHFTSDTPELRVRWTLTSSSMALSNMSASGASGLDLYVRTGGGWRWLAAARPGASREGNADVLFERMPSKQREFLLYLPLYNGVESLQLGVPAGSRVEGAARSRKPIVFYGTSIVQGGCAMRPGMAYPSMLGRRLDRPIVNLGFSGNGKAEPEVAALLAELDPAAYVEAFAGVLRRSHPATPIVLVENLEYPDGSLIAARRAAYEPSNRILRGIYERLGRADPELYYIPAAGLIGTDGDATVDGIHPTDLGMLRMTDGMEPVLRRALRGR